jgi:hypothetical protein
LPITEYDYPFRLEVTSQARREIGHTVAREDSPEPRTSFGRGTITATLQRVDNPANHLRHPPHAKMSPRRTVDIGWNKPTGSEHFNGKGDEVRDQGLRCPGIEGAESDLD